MKTKKIHKQYDIQTIEEPEIIKYAKKGNVEIIKKIINEKNIDEKNKNGWTALMFASCFNHIKTVQLLLENNAQVNIQNYWNNTALIFSCADGYVDIAQMLITSGADVNLKNKNEWTALLWASENEHTEIVKLLLQSGAEIPKDYSQRFPKIYSTLKQ